jgi:hypothetical protein
VAGLVRRRAPDEADDVLEHQHQREGQQELEALVARVDGAHDPLDGRPDDGQGQPGGQQHEHEQRGRQAGAQRPRHRRDADVGAQRVERAAGEVEDPLHAEDELQAGGDEEQPGGVEGAAERDAQELLQQGGALTPSRS